MLLTVPAWQNRVEFIRNRLWFQQSDESYALVMSVGEEGSRCDSCTVPPLYWGFSAFSLSRVVDPLACAGKEAGIIPLSQETCPSGIPLRIHDVWIQGMAAS